MNPFYIPPPRLWLNLLGKKFSKNPSVLDAMTPEQLQQLTPEARAALSAIPEVQDRASEGAMANFTGAIGALPSWLLNAGKVVIGPSVQKGRMTDAGLLHEGLHGIDWNLGLEKEWKDVLSKASPETRAELIRRSQWGKGSGTGYQPNAYSGSNMSYGGHIIDPGEALAYAGMYGYENVPEEFKTFFSKILKSNTKGAETNPSKSVRDNLPPAPTSFKPPKAI